MEMKNEKWNPTHHHNGHQQWVRHPSALPTKNDTNHKYINNTDHTTELVSSFIKICFVIRLGVALLYCLSISKLETQQPI